MTQEFINSSIKVLVRLNENREITQIGSSIFLDYTDFIVIDEGVGDKFAHAQNQYLDMDLADDYGRYNYKYIDNIVTEIINPPYVDAPKTPTTEEVLLESAIDIDYRLSMIEMGLI